MNTTNPGQCLSAGARFATFLGSIGASSESVDAFIKNGSHPFYATITAQFGPKPVVNLPISSEVAKVLENWRAFYQKFFGIEVDLSALRIPEKVEGFDRLIVIVKGLRLNQVWNVHKERDIPRWQWWTGSLEKKMQESERGQVKETYAFWVRYMVEADEDLKNLSAVEIAEQKIDTENLLERLVHGLKYFDETGKHLDVSNITLCASSRYADGDVPFVGRDSDGDVSVYRYGVQSVFSDLHARRAVR